MTKIYCMTSEWYNLGKLYIGIPDDQIKTVTSQSRQKAQILSYVYILISVLMYILAIYLFYNPQLMAMWTHRQLILNIRWYVYSLGFVK